VNPPNISASVRARLLNLARTRKHNFDLILTRFCLERLLYRISISLQAERFLLKGAMLFDLWFDIPHRATRDIDLLGFGSSDLKEMEETFISVCSIDVPDGVAFDAHSVKATEIRNEANYPGVRLTLFASVDGARCHLQVDIGFGDAVTPGPDDVIYPVLLDDLEAPHLRTYPHYTVVSEKFQTLATLGIANSRMKDYFDLWILAHRSEFEGELLRQSIRATFERRQTALPVEPPVGLTEAFAQDAQKQKQWQAFMRKNALDPLPLAEVIGFIAEFLLPVVHAATTVRAFSSRWPAGGPWS
jgi:hypothetical protein